MLQYEKKITVNNIGEIEVQLHSHQPPVIELNLKTDELTTLKKAHYKSNYGLMLLYLN